MDRGSTYDVLQSASVDGARIVEIDLLEAAEHLALVLEQPGDKAFNVGFLYAEFTQSARHTQRGEEILQRLDASTRRRILRPIGIIFGLNAEHGAGKLHEPIDILGINVAHPGRHDNRQPSTMRDGRIEGRKLMLKAVACPIAHTRAMLAPDACDTVVSQRARPHDVRSRIVILRFSHHDPCGCHDRAQKPRCDVIGNRHRGSPAEVALHDMRHHIGDTGSGLIRRQREGKLGVHERCDGPDDVRSNAAFQPKLIVADNAGVRRLGAGGRNGEHAGNGQGMGNGRLLAREIPRIALVIVGNANSLGAIDDAAAANRQNNVDALLTSNGNAFANAGNLWVRTHATQLAHQQSGIRKRCFHAVERSATDHRSFAVHNQYALETSARKIGADFVGNTLPEHEFGWRVVREIVHDQTPYTLEERNGIDCSRPPFWSLGLGYPFCMAGAYPIAIEANRTKLLALNESMAIDGKAPSAPKQLLRLGTITAMANRNQQSTQRNPRSSKRSLPAVPLTVIAVTVALLIGVAMAGSSCSSGPMYHWDNLKNENGRMVYYENDKAVSATGIDVSDLQGDIDWFAVRNDGIDFAMLRCGRRGQTEGGLYADSKFHQNVTGATQAGLPFGVYFYSQAVNEQEAQEEAEYVLSLIDGCGVQYPVVYDQENVANGEARANGLSSEQLTRNAQAFCSTVENAGYTPMIYGNQYDLSLLSVSKLKCAVWYAEYNSEHPTSTFHDMVMWQYSHTGTVSGVSTQVDLNILFPNDWVSPER